MGISRDAIFAAQDRKTESVPAPEWGGAVKLTTISGTERDAFESTITNAQGKVTAENIRAKLLVRCIVDDEGRRIFTDADADALGQKSANVLDRLFTVARKLNGLSAADVDELAKN